jgi:hypothetical protein
VRGLLRANVTEGRRVLAKLLKGRLMFESQQEGQRRFYRIRGEGTLMPTREGIVEVPVTSDGVPKHSELEPDHGVVAGDG